MQDVLIVIGAAIFANILLLGAIGWFLMRARRLPKSKAVPPPRPAAAAVAPSVAATPATPRRSKRDRFSDMIDGSVGMFLFRRILGRPTEVRSKDAGAPLTYLDEDVVASRIGAASVEPTGPVPPVGPIISRPTRLVVAGSATAPLVAATAPVKISPPLPTPPSARRNRLVRDTFVTVGAFAVVLLFAAALLPGYMGRSTGEVLDATGTPEASTGIVITAPPTPSQDAMIETPSPSPSLSESPAPSASFDVIPTASPTPVPTPKPTAKPHITAPPTAAPTPKPTASPTPKPTKTPKPTASPPPPPVAAFGQPTVNGEFASLFSPTAVHRIYIYKGWNTDLAT